MKKIFFLILICGFIFTYQSFSQKDKVYNSCKGKNYIFKESSSGSSSAPNYMEDSESKTDLSKQGNQSTGNQIKNNKKAEENMRRKEVNQSQKEMVEADHYGNPQGNQYDLAVDGAFKGQTIAVMQLYTGENFDFNLPKKALEEKGFNVYRWLNAPPSPAELEKALKKSCQLWIISSSTRLLTPEHLKIIKAYFDQGHGIYIWGDNDPYYADANAVCEYLFDSKMTGNSYADQVVGVQGNKSTSGIISGHLVSTGIQNIYEGITIATIENNSLFQPLIYGSAGNLVTALFDHNGKRAIIDGGFTRLYVKWNTAGTGRYVKNAAAWLVNYEKFGDNKSAQ